MVGCFVVSVLNTIVNEKLVRLWIKNEKKKNSIRTTNAMEEIKCILLLCPLAYSTFKLPSPTTCIADAFMDFFHSKIFCVKFLFSSSLDVEKRCGALEMVFRTRFMLGNVLLVLESAVVDQDDDGTRPLPPPPDSMIVGIAVLLLRLKDPRRKERDSARESGRNLSIVEDLLDVSGASAACLVSNSCVTNLSSKTKSASDDFELRLDNPLDPLLMVPPLGIVDDIGNTSESYKKENPKDKNNHLLR